MCKKLLPIEHGTGGSVTVIDGERFRKLGSNVPAETWQRRWLCYLNSWPHVHSKAQVHVRYGGTKSTLAWFLVVGTMTGLLGCTWLHALRARPHQSCPG